MADDVCYKCGDRGYSWLLVSCSGCDKYVEHQYCFDEIPMGDEAIEWLCKDCDSKPSNPSFPSDEESGIPIDATSPQNLGTYLFRDREKHSIKILNDSEIVGRSNVSRKKKCKLNLPPKPHNPTFGNKADTKISNGANLQPQPDTYLFRDRRKCSLNLLKNKKNISIRRSSRRKSSSDIIEIGATNVSREPHVRSFKLLGLKTWGRYRKRSSFGAATNKDAFHDLSVEKLSEGAKPSVHTRKLVLSEDEVLEELGENVVHKTPNVGGCVNREESEIHPKEGGSGISLEDSDGLNSRKRKSENPPRVVEERNRENLPRESTSGDVTRDVEKNVEPTNEFYYVSAWPIVNYSWRGFFKINGKTLGPLNAHLSTKACEKAWIATKALPPIIHLSLAARLHAWPKSVQVSPPTDDHIALFFFPCYSWVEEMVAPLLQEIIKSDLVLKIAINDAELLVSPSSLLPRDYRKFEDKLYLWGTFRARQPEPTNPVDQTKQDQHVPDPKTLPKQPNLSEIADTNQDKNKDESNESSHLTDESSSGNLDTTDSANKKPRKNGCLNLFPTEVENIELRSKLAEGKNRLDLELGLCLPFAKTTNETTSLNVRSILDKDKLNGTNFPDWFRNLRTVLKAEGKLYVLEGPIPEIPPSTASKADRDAYEKHYNDGIDVWCLILAIMDSELQKQMENTNDPYVVITMLKEMFQDQARNERHKTTEDLCTHKMVNGSSVSAHVLKMKNYNNHLEQLGAHAVKELATNLILDSLPSEHKQFIRNCNMHWMEKSISEMNMKTQIGRDVLSVQIGEGSKMKVKGKYKSKGKVFKNKTPKDGLCFFCNNVGHWKRNCELYIEDVRRRRKSMSITSGL